MLDKYLLLLMGLDVYFPVDDRNHQDLWGLLIHSALEKSYLLSLV